MNRVRALVHGEALQEKGHLGKGVTVAVLDSGAYAHPDYKERIVGFQDFLGGRIGCYDDYGHGTHVTGILGGSGKLSGGKYRGIAPECLLLPVKVLDQRGNGNRRDVIRGLDWVLKNKKRYGIQVVNISVGTLQEGIEDELLVKAVEAVWDAGITVVAAAGNMGPKAGTVTSPGSSRKVITVGSFDDETEAEVLRGIHAGYSGRGPTGSCIIKPEILAPGSGIVSCNSRFRYTKKAYTVKSGTSMATPVVSGAAALLLERHPDMSNLEIKIRMKNCADDLGRPKNQQGWGKINLERLLREN